MEEARRELEVLAPGDERGDERREEALRVKVRVEEEVELREGRDAEEEERELAVVGEVRAAAGVRVGVGEAAEEGGAARGVEALDGLLEGAQRVGLWGDAARRRVDDDPREERVVRRVVGFCPASSLGARRCENVERRPSDQRRHQWSR